MFPKIKWTTNIDVGLSKQHLNRCRLKLPVNPAPPPPPPPNMVLELEKDIPPPPNPPSIPPTVVKAFGPIMPPSRPPPKRPPPKPPMNPKGFMKGSVLNIATAPCQQRKMELERRNLVALEQIQILPEAVGDGDDAICDDYVCEAAHQRKKDGCLGHHS